jgi:hypothetical protein
MLYLDSLVNINHYYNVMLKIIVNFSGGCDLRIGVKPLPVFYSRFCHLKLRLLMYIGAQMLRPKSIIKGNIHLSGSIRGHYFQSGDTCQKKTFYDFIGKGAAANNSHA